MSRNLIYVFVLVFTAGLIFYLSNRSDPDNPQDKAGFNEIDIDANFLSNLLEGNDSIDGIRVYNAKNPSTSNVGLIFVAVDEEGTELTIDRQGSIYFLLEPEQSEIQIIERSLAERYVENIGEDSQIRNLVTVFKKSAFEEAWGDDRIPIEVRIVPATYIRNNVSYNSAHINYRLNTMPDELFIESAPCPPYCPMDILLYNPLL